MSDTAGGRVVLCMKWGTKYGPEYVNRLYGMVRRHLQRRVPLRLPDRPQRGIVPRGAMPADPAAGTARRAFPSAAGPKLTTFAADLHGLRGTALFLDLDVVIVDDITPFFELPGDFLIIHDWKRPWRVTGNSSVYRFRLGAHADVLAHFREHVNERARAGAQRTGLPVGLPAPARQAGLLASRVVRELEVPLPAALSAELLARRPHARRVRASSSSTA